VFRFLGNRFLKAGEDRVETIELGEGESGADASGDLVAQEPRATVAGGSERRPFTAPSVIVNQADAPSCSDCGSIMIRNCACYKCPNCGSTSGCS